MTTLPMRWGTCALTQTRLNELETERLHDSSYLDASSIKRLLRRINHAEYPVYDWIHLAHRFDQIANRHRDDVALFFRHGMTKYNQRNLVSGQHDTVLAPSGKRQAAGIAETLPSRLDLIVCSALSRTIQTMILSVPRSILRSTPVFVDPRLNEVNLGYLQGRRRMFLPQFEAGDIDYAPPNGESYREAAHRVLSSIVDIFDLLAHSGGSGRVAAIFCHAGVLRILSSLTRKPTSGYAMFQLDHGNADSLVLRSPDVRLPPLWLSGRRDD